MATPRTNRLKETFKVVTAAELRGSDQESTAELVKADDGRTSRDRAFADLIRIVQHAETLRFEGQTSIEARSLNDEIERALDDGLAQQTQREQVNPETIRRGYEAAGKLVAQFETWMVQRGLIEDGGE